MSKISFAEIVSVWESALGAARDHSEDGADFEPYLGDLKRHLDKLRKLKARQDSAKALRQRCTQEIKEEIREGQAVMMRLRSIARAKLGPHNEVLVQFGVAPVRTGPARRKSRAAKPQPAPGETPPAEPGGGGGVN